MHTKPKGVEVELTYRYIGDLSGPGLSENEPLVIKSSKKGVYIHNLTK